MNSLLDQVTMMYINISSDLLYEMLMLSVFFSFYQTTKQGCSFLCVEVKKIRAIIIAERDRALYLSSVMNKKGDIIMLWASTGDCIKKRMRNAYVSSEWVELSHKSSSRSDRMRTTLTNFTRLNCTPASRSKQHQSKK